MDHKQRLLEQFPIGTKYGWYRDLTDKCWDTDFAMMKECGLDTARVHATWGTCEPNEGEYDFDYMDRITACAVKHGLKVIFTLYLVCSPEWLFEKHPDARYVSANGTKWNAVMHSDAATGGWPGLCYDSDEHRKTAERFVKAITEHYRGNEDVIAFDVFHEPTEEPNQQYYQNDWREKMYCYCDHSVAKFRLWLEKKYGTLQKLNDVWTRQYQRWDQVQPPRSIGAYTDWLDWKHFRVDAQVDMVKFLSDAVKKYDPARCTVVHTPIYETAHRVITSNDHFKLTPATDMFGSSVYDTITPEVSATICDLLRSAADNGPYWIGETHSGAGPMYIYVGQPIEMAKPFSLPITSAEIKKHSWGQIARGTKGILYWGWRPEITTLETIALGFTERDGSRSERTQALTEFTSVFRQYKKELTHAFNPPSEVAMLYNMDSIFQEGLVSIATINNASGMSSQSEPYYKDVLSMFGAYKLCMKMGIQTDLISKDKVLAGELSRYKLLLMPYSINVTADLAEKIAAFVRAGGKVISDGLCGFFTDDGWGAQNCPPGALAEVFGVDVKSDYGVIGDCDVFTGDAKAYRNVGKHIREKLTPAPGAEIAATYDNGAAAVVKNRCGKGLAAYIGTLFFGAATWNYSADTNALFKVLLDLVGFRSGISIEGPAPTEIVEVRLLDNGGDVFVFVINQNAARVRARVRVPVAAARVREIISGEEIGGCLKSDALDIEGVLEPHEVRIYYCTK